MTRFARRVDEAGVIETRASGQGGPGSSASRFARLVGATGLLALTVLLFWLLTDDGFRVAPTDVTVTGIRLADSVAVRDHISGIDRGPNVFRLRAVDIVEDMGALPEVSFARASVTLPTDVTVEVVERQPIFIWSNGGEAWFVDETGVLFSPRDESIVAEAVAAARARVDAGAAPVPEKTAAPADGDETSPAVGDGIAGDVASTAANDRGEDAGADADAALAALPILEDARIVDEPFVAGDRLPAIDFAVMRQLLGITPAFLGSESAAISLRIDERDGFVLESEDPVWQAVFGHYRANVKPPDVVPLQAQCLASLLATKQERRLERVVLVPSEDRCGTFRTVGSRDPEA